MARIVVMQILSLWSICIFAQPEVSPWSNISGIRVDGELLELNSALGLVSENWEIRRETAKERAKYSYHRNLASQRTSVEIDGFQFDQVVEDLGGGRADVRVQFKSEKDTQVTGAFLLLQLPLSKYADAQVQFVQPAPIVVDQIVRSHGSEIMRGAAHGIQLSSSSRQLDVHINEGTEIFVQKDSQHLKIYFALATGTINDGLQVHKSLSLKARGLVDRDPVSIHVDTASLGSIYEGFGGNFRLQNPNTDPQVIDYCLDNLDLHWGRVEMPWRYWHEVESDDPMVNARRDGVHPRVDAALKMAKRLQDLEMPLVLSAWFAPDWAIVGERNVRRLNGIFGNPLDSAKTKQIYRSIADYVAYAKKKYKIDFDYFSFNESDLGIDIRQTAAEHALLIKGLGAHFRSRGLKTQFLLGDTADARGWPFIKAAVQDSSTHPYIGAISFHSWRGYEDDNLQQWRDAADAMQLPLLVGEGSMDAGAWRYPDIFSEPTFALEEMNLYTRILRICQPASILQWQLTADYSPMIGGGVFGNFDLPLQPTQRFYNFQQLSRTPENLHAMPVTASSSSIECAAMGDPRRALYTIHLVNNGAERMITIKGIPTDIKHIQSFITNANRSMSKQRVSWREGVAKVRVEPASFLTIHFSK